MNSLKKITKGITKSISLSAFLILLMVFSGGCAHKINISLHKDSSSLGEMAILEESHLINIYTSYRCQVIALDGRDILSEFNENKLNLYQYNRIELTSGKHMVIALYHEEHVPWYTTLGGGFAKYKYNFNPVSITFVAKPGGRYLLKNEVVDYEKFFINYWIEDMDTKEIVGHTEINALEEL